MNENITHIIIGFVVGLVIGFVPTALFAHKADYTINRVLENKTVEVNKTYLDSIATLNQELDYHKDLVRTKEHERMAYDLSASAYREMLTGCKNEVEFYHKLFLNNTKLKAIKLDTLIIKTEN